MGLGGTILTSSDIGATWTSQTGGTDTDLYGVSCPSTNLCVAVGGSNPLNDEKDIILTSPDGGTKWTRQTLNSIHGLIGISCPSTNVCAAVGGSGTLLEGRD